MPCARIPLDGSAARRLALLLLLLLLLLLWIAAAAAPAAGPAAAQVVETDPPLPTAEAPVTVFFNADEGDGGLAGYDGAVYAHTGVYTDQSPDAWTCVKNDWPTADTFTGNRPDTQMERVGEDRYRLDIADLRAYYNDNETGCTLGAEEQIQSLNFVFRNADGSLEGKAAGGQDILVALASAGGEDASVDVRFSAPSVSLLDPLVTQADTTFAVTASALAQNAALEKLTLLVNGEAVDSTTASDALTYNLTLAAPGDYDVAAIAEASGGLADTAAFRAVRAAETASAPLPPGLEDGINYTSDTEATLVLRAPYKQYAHVIGDVTGWAVRPAYQMQRAYAGTDSARFWLALDGLEPGTEVGFQYLVDGQLRVGEPYAEKVLTFNDGALSAATYPNLKPYPSGQTEQIVSVLRAGQRPYDFTATGYERPAQKDLVIYEMLVRDFVEKHDYATLADTLDYLGRLGVTALELMPVAEFDGNESWGYNPSFHLAADKYYGPAEDLKALVDLAHARGMAVILDVVYNQATGQSPLVRLYNEGDYGPPTGENLWLNAEARHPFNVFNDFNHESPATRYWLDRANRHWLTAFNVDGFRFDLSKGFTQGPADTDPESEPYTDVGNWSSYDPERIETLERMADRIWATDPGAYVILEHFAENSEEQELVNYRREEGRPGMMVWNNLNRAYSQSAMSYVDDGSFSSDLSASYAPARGLPTTGAVTYMESHDEQWLMYRNIAYGPTAGDYDITDFETAFNRQKLVGAFFFTVPGPRMLWQFGELGYGYGEGGEQCLRGSGDECPAAAPDRTAPKPIRWDYRQDPARRRLYKTWAALLGLRSSHDVFTAPGTDVTLDVDQGDVTRSITLSNGDLQVLVLGNFGTAPTDIEAPFPAAGTWHDFFPGDALDIPNADTAFAYAPGEFHIYTSEPVATPEAGLVPFGATRAAGEETGGGFEPPTSVDAQFDQTFGDAGQTQNYRLVALPGQSGRRLGSGVSGAPGEAWQAYWDTGADGADYLSAYRDGDDQFDYAPGRGFWMISDNPRAISGTFAAVALGAGNAYALSVHAGWNIISNPFGEDVAWSDVQAASGTEQPLWRWNHGSGGFRRVSTFASAAEGTAFYFFNDTGAGQLTVPYPGAPGGAAAGVRGEAAGQLTLAATAGEQRIGRVTVGTRAGAEAGADRFDQPAPPERFARAAWHLSAPAAKGRAGAWAADFRAPGANGYAYDLVLKTAGSGRAVRLAASGLGGFAGQEVRLVERATAEAHDLRATPTVRVQTGSGETRLTLLAGSAAFVEQHLAGVVPEEAQLRAAYPNPLRPGEEATIAYALPTAAAVRLDVFDVLGRRVETLVDERQDAGFHEAMLRAGRLASGVYFYRLTADGPADAFIDTGRLVLVR